MTIRQPTTTIREQEDILRRPRSFSVSRYEARWKKRELIGQRVALFQSAVHVLCALLLALCVGSGAKMLLDQVLSQNAYYEVSTDATYMSLPAANDSKCSLQPSTWTNEVSRPFHVLGMFLQRASKIGFSQAAITAGSYPEMT